MMILSVISISLFVMFLAYEPILSVIYRDENRKQRDLSETLDHPGRHL